MTQTEFFSATQSLETMPGDRKREQGFVSVAQYPRGFEPEDDEFGMIVRDGKIVKRMFSSKEYDDFPL